MAGLHHQVEQVAEHRGFGNASVFHSVELDEAQHRDPPGRQDAEQRLIEQPHEMSHLDDPTALESVELVKTGEEDIGAALEASERDEQWRPERGGDSRRPALVVERVHAAPVPVGCDVTGQDAGDRVWRRGRHLGLEAADHLLLGLKVGHDGFPGWSAISVAHPCMGLQ